MCGTNKDKYMNIETCVCMHGACQCVCVCAWFYHKIPLCFRGRVELQLPLALSRIMLIAVKCADTLHPLKKNTLATILNEFDSN